MKPIDIETLAGKLQALGISECEVETSPGSFIKLRFGTDHVQARAEERQPHSPVRDSAVDKVIRSKEMGRFSARHPLRDAPAAMEGEEVAAGQTVGYLLAKSVIHEILAPDAGRLGRVLVSEGGLVGYGQAIFELR
ncbi:acetyl-CoA carboxylase biotin carboxyl carrier protein subunit [Cupriavidus sp. L7L]|uniref:acetyl-CoA carboxylase biotin carboxyl carrier protein subunit n=1 Tax=Cupriavidus sp. L7L TaxID=2546443 RepID=UPI0010569D7B|nr:acetyl-CoA carboxylase biotin carboxyl carrier protein subunit [Cupriavidus sp. L7L]TDF63183.1 acetyl-CoA carboxylase biotin carboxyl carrier protein subunit [Cupriavidus sp. L7L]